MNQNYIGNYTGMFLETISSFIGSILTPTMLLISAVVLFPSSGIIDLLKPITFLRHVTEKQSGSHQSPLSALSIALAGTLGVGNITGVASALMSGGPGAVFWMWIGGFVVIAVKYSEVALAVKFREKSEKGFHGGAMYYIRDGLAGRFPAGFCHALSAFFALLCCANSLITGNLVQSNAAASILPGNHKFFMGIIMTAAVSLSIIAGADRIGRITEKTIPLLTGAYILLSGFIILQHRIMIGEILADIFSSAFSLKAATGGALGFSVREAVRFGVMRGIFSNEAGCGTSPTAHASADTVSPRHQGCLGVIEVVFDTHILCTLSALVFIIADRRFGCMPWGTGSDLSLAALEAFGRLGGKAAYIFLTAAVILFAYSTIIAQFYYGCHAIRFLSSKKEPQLIFCAITAVTVMLGVFLDSPVVWFFADIIIGIMTTLNCLIIILLRRELRYFPSL